MRIASVALTNIKSFVDVRVDFTDGVNAIVGLNGAGKSTLLEAIGFALFNCLDYKQEQFLRQGAADGRVVVAFQSDLDDRTYEVVRNLGSNTKQYVFDPELGVQICAGAADVPRFLREHMRLAEGVDHEQLFRDAIGVPQGTLTAVFLLAHSPRKQVFDPLLNVEEFQQAFAMLLDAKNLLGTRVGETSVTIAHLEGLLAQLPALHVQAATVAADRAANETALLQAMVDLAEATDQRTRLDAHKAHVEAMQKQVDAVRAELDKRDAQSKTAEVSLDDAVRASEVVRLHQEEHDRYLASKRRRDELEPQLTQRQALEIERATLSGRLNQARDRADAAKGEIAQVEAAERRLLELEPKAARQVELDALRTHLLGQVAQLGATRQMRELAQAKLVKESATFVSLRERLAQLPVIEAEIAAAESEVNAGKLAREALAQETAEIKARGIRYRDQNTDLSKAEGVTLCPVCEQPLDPGHLDHLRVRNEELLVDLRDELKQLHKQQTDLESQIEANEKRRAAFEQNKWGLPSASAIAETEHAIADTQGQIDAHTRRIVELEAAAGELQSLEQETAKLGNPKQERDLMAHIAAKRASVSHALDEAIREIEISDRRVEEVVGALTGFAGLDEEMQTLAVALAALSPAYEAVLGNQQVAATLTSRRAAAEAAKASLADAESRCAVAEAAAKTAAAAFDATAYRSALGEEARLQGLLGGLNSRRAMLAKESSRLETEIAALSAHEVTLAEARRNRLNLVEQERVLDKMRTVIRSAGPHVTRRLIGRISLAAAQYFAELTGDYARHLRWNEDYSITLEVDGRVREFKTLSGGEQMVAALAVRLALLREVSTIDIAFFDEPTAHLDIQKKEALARQILAVKGFRQIFVISHDDAFENYTDNAIHLERVDGASRIVVQ